MGLTVRRLWAAFVLISFSLTLMISFQNCAEDAFTANKFTRPITGTRDSDGDDGKTDGPSSSTKILSSLYTGNFLATAAGLLLYPDLSGKAWLSRSLAGKTEVYVHVNGLTPSRDYMAHVHNLPCSLGGGGHYLIDPNVVGTVEANEIWPSFTTDPNGNAVGYAAVNSHIARPEAQSVVVHEPGSGDRIACVDLHENQATTTSIGGYFKNGAGGNTLDLNIGGTATITRNSNGNTEVDVSVRGLPASLANYPAHVHNLPCEINDGGAHYMIDPTSTVVEEANEIWPIGSSDASGNSITHFVKQGHRARPEAQAIVIHNPADGSRLACATLNLRNQFKILDAGLLAELDVLGTISISRGLDGTTKITLDVAGLDSNTDYGAHVHNLPCSLGGGGHYKIDPDVSEVIRENEIWPSFKTDDTGRGLVDLTVAHLARPEAQSIVIHEPGTGARLVCADFE